MDKQSKAYGFYGDFDRAREEVRQNVFQAFRALLSKQVERAWCQQTRVNLCRLLSRALSSEEFYIDTISLKGDAVSMYGYMSRCTFKITQCGLVGCSETPMEMLSKLNHTKVELGWAAELVEDMNTLCDYVREHLEADTFYEKKEPQKLATPRLHRAASKDVTIDAEVASAGTLTRVFTTAERASLRELEKQGRVTVTVHRGKPWDATITPQLVAQNELDSKKEAQREERQHRSDVEFKRLIDLYAPNENS